MRRRYMAFAMYRRRPSGFPAILRIHSDVNSQSTGNETERLLHAELVALGVTHDGQVRGPYGSTWILRPTPAANCSSAWGYLSSGSRSLMNTSGSRTPVANRSAARS